MVPGVKGSGAVLTSNRTVEPRAQPRRTHRSCPGGRSPTADLDQTLKCEDAQPARFIGAGCRRP